MKFSIIFETGDAYEEADGDVEWLGAFNCERGGEPEWTEDDG
jgi:hypothetical protein